LPNCSTCPIFHECPINVPGETMGNPEADCPILKLIKKQK